MTAQVSECCIRGTLWEGEPEGRKDSLDGRPCYVTGSNPRVAIMIIHDLFGWTFRNIQRLADHYATEADATVYVPDFFGGEVLPLDIVLDQSQWSKLDLPAFMGRNTKAIRTPEILGCAKELRSKYERVGAIGFCFGGWGSFRLAGKEHKLVDCIAVAHPTMLEKEEISNVGVPVLIMAPEFDPMFTPELKAFANQTIPTLGVPYDYQYFPGVEHAFAVRGDPKNPGEREAMDRAKDAAVLWFHQWLHKSPYQEA
ncbi:Alpha/Beta hydrolase protein [Leptodontidium sp. MPI-SDFR-AT-0119]|nr:Alpha/Beta hydrolase protein [Leptodontidium sp. MPI-SDFR-AT-0119]